MFTLPTKSATSAARRGAPDSTKSEEPMALTEALDLRWSLQVAMANAEMALRRADPGDVAFVTAVQDMIAEIDVIFPIIQRAVDGDDYDLVAARDAFDAFESEFGDTREMAQTVTYLSSRQT